MPFESLLAGTVYARLRSVNSNSCGSSGTVNIIRFESTQESLALINH